MQSKARVMNVDHPIIDVAFFDSDGLPDERKRHKIDAGDFHPKVGSTVLIANVGTPTEKITGIENPAKRDKRQNHY